jgi:hypothetical protein
LKIEGLVVGLVDGLFDVLNDSNFDGLVDGLFDALKDGNFDGLCDGLSEGFLVKGIADFFVTGAIDGLEDFKELGSNVVLREGGKVGVIEGLKVRVIGAVLVTPVALAA